MYSEGLCLVEEPLATGLALFLGELGQFEHQIGLSQPFTRAPFVYLPAHRNATPSATGSNVQTVDISPTTMDSLGMEIPDFVRVFSLLEDQAHPVIAQHYADLHTSDWFSGQFSVDQIVLQRNEKKLILSSDGTTSPFDLAQDSGEERDLANSDRETRDQMSETLTEWFTGLDRRLRPESRRAEPRPRNS